MIDEYLDLRNRTHNGDFRFVVTSDLWHVLYEAEDRDDSVRVTKDDRLRGYAAYSIIAHDEINICEIRDICFEDKAVLQELIDKVVEKASAKGADFVFLRESNGPWDEVFANKGFFSFVESVIMVVFLDPKKLLSAFSDAGTHGGKVIKLAVEDHEPCLVKIGEAGLEISDKKEDVIISTSPQTFLKIFFGQSSFVKEFLKRKIKVKGIGNIRVAMRFFNLIRQRSWYLPYGDWA